MIFSPEFSNIECTAHQLTEETAAQRFDPKKFIIMDCMLELSTMGNTIEKIAPLSEEIQLSNIYPTAQSHKNSGISSASSKFAKCYG